MKYFFHLVRSLIISAILVLLLIDKAFAYTLSDDFSVDSRAQYLVTPTWVQGGNPQFLYDAGGQRLQVITGDNVGLQFEKALPTASDSGVLGLDFLPTKKYPYGGELHVRLRQDANNYYEIISTDGYGPGRVDKVVNGQAVDSAAFATGYNQNISYHLSVNFTPGEVRVEAFGQVITLTGNSAGILVGTIEVELRQQSAYFDNISFTNEVGPVAPTAEAGSNQTVIEGQSVTLDGSGSFDPDGAIVSYLWEQTTGTSVSFNATAVKPSFTAPPSSGTSETLGFTLTVTDDSGAMASDTVTVTVQPQGAAYAFSDDFSVDSRAQYLVTPTWVQGGNPQFLYDAGGQRLQVVTGDNVGLQFEKALPTASDSGVLGLDFLPTKKYPNGGELHVRLRQDANNYYEIISTDGYGPGRVDKVVNGQAVDSAAFATGYNQNISYHLSVGFTPESVRVEAFGQVITLTGNSAGILVGTIEVELRQQSAYFDNISFTNEVGPVAPTAEAGSNQTVIEGQSVTLDGSGSFDPDGAIVSYLWEQTTGTSVSFNATAVKPSFTAPPSSGTSETLGFTLTVTDDSGAMASDTVTVTVQPQGAAYAFSDDFSVDSRAQYLVTPTWVQGGNPQFLYDAGGQRLQVVTGDNVGLQFEKALPTASDSGVLGLDFLPTKKYPNGGELHVRLRQDANNYYEIISTDGYGPGRVDKVVNGQAVDSAAFATGYNQNISYHLSVSFTPGEVRVEAFGQVITLTGNSAGILVGTIEVELRQQSAYFDNISFTNEVGPVAPTAEAGSNQTVIEGQSVTLDGSGSFDPDGAIVSYLWEQTTGTSVSFNATAVKPSFTAPPSSGTSETLGFTLTVTDDSGAMASDTVTVTVQPQGAAYAFSDDFSVDSRAQYLVTPTWVQGGNPQFLYDAGGQRLQVVTGDNVGLQFEKALPTASDSGVLGLDFLPTKKYPNGGELHVRLRQDANNYYEIISTDGYGPGRVDKVVNGQAVDSAAFATGYNQNISYHLSVGFTPESVRVEAFGQVITLTGNSAGILVGTIEVELRQQTAYFDNISFTSPYNAYPIARFQSQLQSGQPPFTVIFDASKSIDPDGAIMQYLWDFGDGLNTEGMIATHSYASGGSYTVTLTVRDDNSNLDSKVMNIWNDSDRYVAIGDSISWGSADDIFADGIGFEPILAALLNSETGYENIVANEGVRGDTSADGLNLLPSILVNYPDSRYFLILFGSNDAFIPVPSGWNLMPGDPGYAGTFKDNMQRMITAIEQSGKIPYLAKIPFSNGSFAFLTTFTAEYNSVVDELAVSNGIDVVPPNLYCLFESYPNQLSDGLHPNGVGYQSMAQWWLDALTGQNSGACF